MLDRRDLIMGAGCAVAAAGGYALKPRRNVPLLKDAKLSEIIPARFGDWTSQDVGDPLAINGPGTLSAKIYNELLVRLYTNARSGEAVLMLLAYGGRQTDDLQLHRPEICYPAFGYELVRNDPAEVALGKNVTVPVRRLIGRRDQQDESVIYWTRIGETLPRDAAEQRSDRFKIALEGIIPDGLLSRFSAAGVGDNPWSAIEGFVPALLAAASPDGRKVLVGTARAQALGAAA